MKTQKRIILVGPSASGKDFIRAKFRDKGYKVDCSYTSRPPREGEIDGVDYYFIDEKKFRESIDEHLFYEWVLYEETYYGTARFFWETRDIFIMESDGVDKILKKDRKNCLVIFVNTPLDIRIERMRDRGWDDGKIRARIAVDIHKFSSFQNFDLEISSNSIQI